MSQTFPNCYNGSSTNVLFWRNPALPMMPSNPLGLRDLMTASKSMQWNNHLLLLPTSCRLLSANAWSASLGQNSMKHAQPTKNALVTFCCLEDQAIFYHLTWPWDVMPCHFQYTFHLIISHLFPSLLVARLIQNQKHLFTWLEGDCGRGWFLCLPGCPGFEHRNPSPVQEMHGKSRVCLESSS